jgi:hypothetical protein
MNESAERFIDKEGFVAYCKRTAEIVSWIEYFGDMEDVSSQPAHAPNVQGRRILTREQAAVRRPTTMSHALPSIT